MNPERKIQQLEQELSRTKDEKALYYYLAQAAERREAEATASANELLSQAMEERRLRSEAERQLKEAMQNLFNLKKINEELSEKDRSLSEALKKIQTLEEKLIEAQQTIKTLEKKLNVRKGTEDPYGLSTPSSRKVAKPNSTEEKQNKKGGALVGHTGHGRKHFSKDEADEIRSNSSIPEPACCEVPEYEQIDIKVNSYIDFVPAKFKIVYEENTVYQCKSCGKEIVSRSPYAFPKAKYSNNFIGVLLDEAFGNLMPFGTIAERYSINKGTLIDIFHRMANIFNPVFQYVRESIASSHIVHADETTWSVDGNRAYSWFFANENYRLYMFRNTRASSVPKEVFPGDELLDLILVTDRYGGYNGLPVKHQYCYVHLLRDLKKLEADFPDEIEVKKFVEDIKSLLKQVIELQKKKPPPDEHRKIALDLKKQIMEKCNLPAQHPGIQHYQNIFREWESRLFQWTESPDIPCENNFAERNLRPVVIARKISFGCQSEQGMRTREILMTVIQSLKCQGLNPLPYLQDVLTRICEGLEVDPVVMFKDYCSQAVEATE